MFIRIVKLGFIPEKIPEFLNNFERNKEQIRNFEGCLFLELYRDKNNTNQFFTYSYWKDEKALDNYRNSKFFAEVWTETKAMFNQKPEAWSLDRLESLE